MSYTLTDDDALDIAYEAITSATTQANLTQQSYFNLEGEEAGDILDHRLVLDAEAFTPVDAGLTPTGGSCRPSACPSPPVSTWKNFAASASRPSSRP